MTIPWVIVNIIIDIAGDALVRFKFTDVGDNQQNSQSHWEKKLNSFCKMRLIVPHFLKLFHLYHRTESPPRNPFTSN